MKFTKSICTTGQPWDALMREYGRLICFTGLDRDALYLSDIARESHLWCVLAAAVDAFLACGGQRIVWREGG